MTGGDSFTREEALALQGKRYRATAGYSGVPPGTIGRVCDYYPRGPSDAYGVEVAWETSTTERFVDGFSRLDLLTVFTGGPLEGKRAMEPLDGGP